MRIVLAASEAVPFSKTGGLADVAGTLYKEYIARGIDVRLFVPLYQKTREQFGSALRNTGMTLDVPVGKASRPCRVFTAEGYGSSDAGAVYLLDNEELFDREELYGPPAGDYPDNDQRFTFFSRAILDVCVRLGAPVDVVHCNDWQTGLVPLYLKTLYNNAPVVGKALSVLTIHNLGYQGLFPPQTMETTGLGPDLFNPGGIEFYGQVNFLKAGIVGADIITTVSRTYAEEILTPESGFGLDGLLSKRKLALTGILNGIDYNEWDPLADPHLPQTYTKSALTGKAACKRALMEQSGLKGDPSAPLISFIGRLSAQKGVDLIAEALPALLKTGAKVIIIGRGDERYLTLLQSLSERFADSFYFCPVFNEPLAHLTYAGSDMFLMPSLYEPCGLGQLIAMHYGALPLARKTGGLADTVEDGVTGFLFSDYSAAALIAAVQRAVSIYERGKAWQGMVKKAMSRDFSWENSAGRYLELYTQGLTAR
jgi:starch synthase